MAVRLRFQSSGAIPSDSAPLELRGPNMTIGRGASNDVVLPDPDQLLSRNHCVIEDHGNQLVVIDLSSNGTFLNYGKLALGPGPTPLSNGDVLSLGSYELAVEITQDAEAQAQIAPDPLSLDPLAAEPLSPGRAENAPDPFALLDDSPAGGDFLDDLLGDSAPKGPSLLNPVDPIDDLLPPLGAEEDPFFQKPKSSEQGASLSAHNPAVQDSFSPHVAAPASHIPDDWEDELFAGIGEPTPSAAVETPPSHVSEPELSQPPLPPKTTSQEITDNPFSAALPGVEDRTELAKQAEAVPAPAPEPAVQVPVPPKVVPATPSVATSPAAPEAGGSVAAFLQGLELDSSAIPAEEQVATMERMGRVMRTLITGLREILMTRTSIKSEFRIEQTMISAGGNNPLKFSISPEQAIETMVKPRARGYLDADKAVDEALRDIKAHEVAMVTGMEAALKGVLAKLDPKLLESQIEKRGGIGGLFSNRKAQYWDVYEELYAEISDQAENEFHDLFSREFARAYKTQLDRLKKENGV